MAPKRNRPSTTPKRTTRSSTAGNPSQEFVELTAPTRKRSVSSAASRSSGEQEPPKITFTRSEQSAGNRSLRRHFTIELPAQQARAAAQGNTNGEQTSSAGHRSPTSPTTSRDVTAVGSNATPSPTPASPWGLTSLFNTVRRVLSPFPPSKKLEILSVTPIKRTAELSPINEIEDTPSKIPETPVPTSAPSARKRKPSVTEEPSHKRARVMETETPRRTVAPTPRKTPVTQQKRTPGRRSSRSVRQQRFHTPAKDDEATNVPYVPSSFSVPEEPDMAIDPVEREESVVSKMFTSATKQQDPFIDRTPQPKTPSTGTVVPRATEGPEKTVATNPASETSSPETSTKKRKRVKIEDLNYIPSRRPGQSGGTFALLDEFFDQDQDSVEIDESELEVISERPTKKARTERNVFDIANAAASPEKVTISPSKPNGTSTASRSNIFDASPPSSSGDLQPPAQKPAASSTFAAASTSAGDKAGATNAQSQSFELTPANGPTGDAALQRKRSEAEKYKPTKGSRLREVQRSSSASTLLASPGQLTAVEENDSSAQIPPSLPSFGSDAASRDPAPPFAAQAGTIQTPPVNTFKAPPQPSFIKPTSDSASDSTFPAGISLTTWGVSQEDINWARKHPPSATEIDEAYEDFKGGLAGFLAAGGADKPLTDLIAV